MAMASLKRYERCERGHEKGSRSRLVGSRNVRQQAMTQKTEDECPTSGSSRPGQAAGFRPAKVFGCVERLSWFGPLVRSA